MDSYKAFISSKTPRLELGGLSNSTLPKVLKPFQRAATAWSLRRCKSALFAGTGLGKTLQQLTWSREVGFAEDGDVLIVAPLAVAGQTIREADKFGFDPVVFSEDGKSKAAVTITNYDRVDRFDPADFAAIVLDESSILKHEDSKTRLALTEAFCDTKWKLCCTATPAPNDFLELGTHSEFLGVLDQAEMLATFFVHDGAIRAGDVADDWRLKRHAEQDFWQWLSTWALVYSSPADLGFTDPQYTLPLLRKHIVEIDVERKPPPGKFFASGVLSLQDRVSLRKQTVVARCRAAAELINAEPNLSWLIWCGRNDEADLMESLVPGSQQVSGAMDRALKFDRLMGFVDGKPRKLITKPSIAGFGMNWQHCHKMAFIGLNDSFEQLYQAIRRCWRFGQKSPVDAYLFSSSAEYAVLSNVLEKERRSDHMYSAMKALSRQAVQDDAARASTKRTNETKPIKELPSWLLG